MLLAADTLTVNRAGRQVLRDISFSLRPGEGLVVTGRNGAGKSTLLAAMAGLLRPSSGGVTLSGSGERSLSESVHHHEHRDGLKAALTAGENLAFAAACLGEAGLPPGEALARVGLAGGQHIAAGRLSAGQRRRVMLARLLVASRPIWLLDEPTTALDAAGQDMVSELMHDHLARGGLLIVATHAPLRLAGGRALTLGGAALTAAAGPAAP